MTFWSELDGELSRFPARPVVEPDAAMSTDYFRCYRVRFTGLDGYRLFGYLSVPTGVGPFPAVLETPRHGSVNHPPHYNDRRRYVMFTMMHRGQRLADVPFTARYPGLFALGVTDPATYVYRAIIADCLRGAEFLLGVDGIDPSRVAVTGEDLALFVAALRPGFSAAMVTAPLLHDAMRRRRCTAEYPLEELNDHLRAHPGDEPAVAATLARYDPVTVAGAITGRVHLAERSGDPVWHQDLRAALGGRLSVYRRTDEDADDVDALDAWLAGALGVAPMPKFLQRVPLSGADR